MQLKSWGLIFFTHPVDCSVDSVSPPFSVSRLRPVLIHGWEKKCEIGREHSNVPSVLKLNALKGIGLKKNQKPVTTKITLVKAKGQP